MSSVGELFMRGYLQKLEASGFSIDPTSVNMVVGKAIAAGLDGLLAPPTPQSVPAPQPPPPEMRVLAWHGKHMVAVDREGNHWQFVGTRLTEDVVETLY